METIVLKPLYHRGKECLGIYFKKNARLQSLIQREVGSRWSKTNNCWYFPLSKNNYEKLAKTLQGKAELKIDELKKYLLDKKKGVITSTASKTTVEKPATIVNIPKAAAPMNIRTQQFTFRLSKENEEALQKFKQMLILKSYSPSTTRTYTNEFLQFLHTIKEKPAQDFSVLRLKDYFQYCHTTLKLSENTLHSRINALKFYFEQVLKREKFFWDIPRPQKKQQLPKIFNQNEIAGIINSLENKKHKVMLMLAYSGGLRVSEVVNLKTYQVDSTRMTIFISQSKGKKDRIVTLSPILLVMLREYALLYKPDKKGYLFEGSIKGTPYSTRSLQEVLQNAKKKAGIMKPGGIHSLRHSFATHLIEKGTDVTMIQKLLGHNDLKTTMIYLHTSNKDLLKIMSPLDDLKLS